MAAACTFVVCCTPYHLTLLAWKQFDNSYGHEPGLADGQGTTAVALQQYWAVWNYSMNSRWTVTCG